MNRIYAAAALLILLFAGEVQAQTLLEKMFPGKKESQVAQAWFDKLPAWVAEQVKINKFPRLYRTDSKDATKLIKFEMCEVDAKGTRYKYFDLVRDGTDAAGQPIYKRSLKFEWVEFTKLEARHLASTYPVKSNQKDDDIVGFAAWIYTQKEKRVANRVLTVLWESKADLKPLIEAYIIEKEGWKAAPGQLEIWNDWDSEYQAERNLLVTPEARDALLLEREKAAKNEFEAIIKARGNYDKKAKAPRKPQPTQHLMMLDYRIREFRRTYKASTFIKGKDVESKLVAIEDSIKDDQLTIKELRKQAADETIGKQKRAQLLEVACALDPEDLALQGEVGNAWIAWADIAPHGNECAHSDGVQGARPHFEKILTVYPENTSYLIWVGKCYQALQDGKAKAYYEKVVKLCGRDKGDGKTAQALLDNMDKKDQARAKKTD